MEEERDKPSVLGQMAGIIAMMSALVKALPPAARKRLLDQMQVEFDSLLASMSTADASQVPAERESVEWMRDLFLRRIAQADLKPTRPRSRKAPAASASGKDSDGPRQPASANVDFEL
jgi:hypothetical protein